MSKGGTTEGREATTKEEACRYYQDFKWKHIANLPQEDFAMPGAEILNFLTEKRDEEKESSTE